MRPSITQYNEDVQLFTEINPEVADQYLQAQAGHIVVVARESCSFSRNFVHRLAKLAKEQNLSINYIHSRRTETLEAVNAFRQTYGVPTVPGLLYSSQSAGIRVRCNSRMSAAEILEFIEAN